MSFEVAIAILLMFSAACYFALAMRLIAAKREIGTIPIGLLFLVVCSRHFTLVHAIMAHAVFNAVAFMAIALQ